MKFNTVKTTLAASAIGLATLLGAMGANAQSRDQNNRFPMPNNTQNQRAEQQRIELEKQRIREEQIRIEQQRQEQIRMEGMRKQNDRDRNGWERNARYKVYQNGKFFIVDSRGLEMLKKAVINGYEEGFKAGQVDKRNKRKGGYYSSNVYRNGNLGYQNYGGQHQSGLNNYQFYFQKGFAEGYQDGFNTRKMRGWGREDAKISQSDLRSILKFERF